MQGLYSNPIQFYDFLQNRVMIVFRPKSDSDPEALEFSLVLSKKQTYDTVRAPCCPVQGYILIGTLPYVCRWLPKLPNIFAMIL
jgi:hypothetical protein